MDMKEFSVRNLRRSQAKTGFNHQLNGWSMSDWFTAVLGELGEAANVAKKLNRISNDVRGNDQESYELRALLAHELADTFIYLDLLAQRCNVDLSEEVPRVFAKKSRELGYVEND